MINELRNQIFNVKRNATDPKLFEEMLITSTFQQLYVNPYLAFLSFGINLVPYSIHCGIYHVPKTQKIP
jgi:hypothetical protein